MIYDVTWRAPGGLKLTFGSRKPSRWARVWDTLPAGLMLYKLWFISALVLLMNGYAPTLSRIADIVIGTFDAHNRAIRDDRNQPLL